jgi:ketol-acid reductoisomerase
MEWLYLSVKTGNEAQISIDKNSEADYRVKLNAELKAMHDMEMWRAGETVRKLRPEYDGED